VVIVIAERLVVQQFRFDFQQRLVDALTDRSQFGVHLSAETFVQPSFEQQQQPLLGRTEAIEVAIVARRHYMSRSQRRPCTSGGVMNFSLITSARVGCCRSSASATDVFPD